MSFDQMMIRFCSPTMCGIKPANIFFIKQEAFSQHHFDEWKQNLQAHGITACSGLLSKDFCFILVFDSEWERKILDNPFVQVFLSGKNYLCNGGVERIINEIINRMQNQICFPHEIGIILGYPIEDVISFEENQGKNCKYCGYWKSYSDVGRAKQSLCAYRKCCNLCMKWLAEGFSVSQIITEYKRFLKAA